MMYNMLFKILIFSVYIIQIIFSAYSSSSTYMLYFASLLVFWLKPKRFLSFSLHPSPIPFLLPLIQHVFVEYHLLARHCSRFWGWSSEQSRKPLLNKMVIEGLYGKVISRLRNLYITFDTDGYRCRFLAVQNNKLRWQHTQSYMCFWNASTNLLQKNVGFSFFLVLFL